jgi:hypothetical protein
MTHPLTEVRYSELHRYATFARAIYDDAPSIKRTHGDSTEVHELAGCRVQFAVVDDRQNAVQWIALRGTFNPRNALVDGRMKVAWEPRLNAYIHSGFLRAAREAYDAIRPMLDPARQIRITGHSLGGAVAVILTALLAEDRGRFTIGRTVTFGQPMVTDINGARLLQKHSLLRIVNRGDPVAMLPLILSRTHFEFPPTLLFHHFGAQLTLYPDGQARYSEGSRLASALLGYRRLLANHVLDLYLQRLSELANS